MNMEIISWIAEKILIVFLVWVGLCHLGTLFLFIMGKIDHENYL